MIKKLASLLRTGLSSRMAIEGVLTVFLQAEDGTKIFVVGPKPKPNRIMSAAKAHLLSSLYDGAYAQRRILTFRVGSGGTVTPGGDDPKPVTDDRTNLFTPQAAPYTNAIAAPAVSVDGKSITYSFSVPSGELNGETINEVGLFKADGSMFNMKTFPSVTKTAGFSLNFSWTIRLP